MRRHMASYDCSRRSQKAKKKIYLEKWRGQRKMHPVESPEEAAGAAEEEALSVVVMTAADAEDLALRQHFFNSMPTTATIATKRIVTVLGMSTARPVRLVRVLRLRRWGS